MIVGDYDSLWDSDWSGQRMVGRGSGCKIFPISLGGKQSHINLLDETSSEY